uniref:Uncharacterized protein n=1 Tax=Peronospora matthiolae TaxID=2874970 RepID=A0AAV1UQL6_9STRA
MPSAIRRLTALVFARGLFFFSYAAGLFSLRMLINGNAQFERLLQTVQAHTVVGASPLLRPSRLRESKLKRYRQS